MKNVLTFILTAFFCLAIHFCYGQQCSDRLIEERLEIRDYFVLLTCDAPDFAKNDARTIVAEKWKIRFLNVGTPTRKKSEEIKVYNQLTIRQLEMRYGIDWENRFKNEVDREFEQQLKNN